MFTKSKEADAVVTPQTPAKETKKNAPSIISADLTVVGALISSGDLQVDGRIEGNIRASALVIGDEALIQGDVYAEDAIIRGRVEGNLQAKKVHLCATAHVNGNILHEVLSMETRAFFEGNCQPSDNPLSDAPPLRVPANAAQPVSAGAKGGKESLSVLNGPSRILRRRAGAKGDAPDAATSASS
jgi:cytoskeletal protein CcmA (bactofilin family)